MLFPILTSGNRLPSDTVITQPYASIRAAAKRRPQLVTFVGLKEKQVLWFPSPDYFVEEERKCYMTDS